MRLASWVLESVMARFPSSAEREIGVVPVRVDRSEEAALVGGEDLDPLDGHGRATGGDGDGEVHGHVVGAGVHGPGGERPAVAGGDPVLEEGGDGGATEV